MPLTVALPNPVNVQAGQPAAGVITVSAAGLITGPSSAVVLPAPTGGVAPYTWEIVSGVLPPGAVLTRDGRILGGTARGSALVTLRVTDSTSPVPQFTDNKFWVTVQ